MIAMQEQMQLETKSSKKRYLIIIIFLVLIILSAWAVEKYNAISYLKNSIAATSSAIDSHQSLSQAVEPLPNEAQVREALHLVQLASQLLQNDLNINVAKDLLLISQGNLNNLHGEKIDQAKVLLDADIAKLNSLQIMDTHALQEQLDVLDKLVNVLPLKHAALDANHSASHAAEVKQEPADSNNIDNAENKWQQSVHEILLEAKSVIKVTKKIVGEQAMSHEVIDLKRAQFKLLIEQARWALFYKQAAAYDRSISQAQVLLLEIFDPNSESVQKFSAILNDLAQVKFDANVPNLQDLVNALQAILVR